MHEDTVARELGSIDARLNNLEANVVYIRKGFDRVQGKVFMISGSIAVIISILGFLFSRVLR